MADSELLASAATSASYNMILQLVFRLLTFFLNAFVLRYISKDLLGVVNVRLTLLYSTILFVSREAFRRAFLNKATVDGKWRQVINILWCTIPITCICSILLTYVWLHLLESPAPTLVPHYRYGVVCFAISAVVEMMAEPLWVVSQNFLFIRLKVCAEGISLLIKCSLIAILVAYSPHLGIVAFCVAQIVFTSIYTVGFYGYFAYLVKTSNIPTNFPFQSLRDFFPSFSQGPFFSWNLVSLVWSFFKQSFLKQLLTEGERYIMSIFDVLSFADQGVYDVINNLGSLAARFIFLPIEDSSYLFFSQTLTRGLHARQQSKEQMQLATQVLTHVLKMVTLIGLIILVFGYSFSYLLLNLYGGSLLSSGTGPSLLKWYCVYVLFLAVNGITECFSFATMGKEAVNRYNQKMLVFSVIFLATSWYLTKPFGSVGFILANCANILARILHSCHYINIFYAEYYCNPLRDIIPAAPVIALLVVAFIATAFSEMMLCCDPGLVPNWAHIAVGGVLLLMVLTAIYNYEYQLVTFFKEQYKLHKSGRHKVE